MIAMVSNYHQNQNCCRKDHDNKMKKQTEKNKCYKKKYFILNKIQLFKYLFTFLPSVFPLVNICGHDHQKTRPGQPDMFNTKGYTDVAIKGASFGPKPSLATNPLPYPFRSCAALPRNRVSSVMDTLVIPQHQVMLLVVYSLIS